MGTWPESLGTSVLKDVNAVQMDVNTMQMETMKICLSEFNIDAVQKLLINDVVGAITRIAFTIRVFYTMPTINLFFMQAVFNVFPIESGCFLK